MKENSLILTVSLLVSNRIDTIRKCMESLRPLLEQLPSELIVVDTVGEENSDGSLAVAKEYATRVVHFDWCNDFAAARNAGLSLAKGEWFLFVDDDEWFEDVTELIAFFKSGESDTYGYGLYHVRNYTGENKYSMAVVGRLIRRTATTCFVGKVHEHFNEVPKPYKQFSLVANHTGYLYAEESKKKEHQRRNLSILEAEMEEQGYTPFLCARNVQELLHVESTREAGFQFCMECLKELEKNPEYRKDSDMQWLLVATVRYYSMKGNCREAKKQILWLRENYDLSQMAQLFLAVLETGVAMEESDLQTVETAVAGYITAWDWLMVNPEEAIIQNQLDFGMYFNEPTYWKMLHIGAMCANALKKYVKANAYWKRFPWKREDLDKRLYQRDMQETLEGLKLLIKK